VELVAVESLNRRVDEASNLKMYINRGAAGSSHEIPNLNKPKECFMNRSISPFLLMSITLLLSQAASAQVRVGVQGGLSVPELSGGNNELSEGYRSRLAPNFGITAQFPVTKEFSIEPEINFDGQGGQRNGMQPITTTALPPLPSGGYYYADFKNTSVLNYVEVPVLAEYTFGVGGLGLEVNAGPYVGFLLNAVQNTSGLSPIYIDKNGTPLIIPVGNGGYVPLPAESFNASTNVTSSINKVNVGIAGGAGLILPLNGRTRISFDVRGLYGLIGIQRYTQDGTSHTGNLIISVGYSYMLLGI
jgi:Outer membrane protein beta-barrel domain